jgi:hypothetical protein
MRFVIVSADPGRAYRKDEWRGIWSRNTSATAVSIAECILALGEFKSERNPIIDQLVDRTNESLANALQAFAELRAQTTAKE